MPLPTTAPVYEIVIGAKPRKFYMGFRAFKKLGLNPFKQSELSDYLNEPDVDKVCALLQAGIENAIVSLGEEGPAPTTEELIDVMDSSQFAEIMQKMSKAKADILVEEGSPEAESDPTIAQSGSQSGQLVATISG